MAGIPGLDRRAMEAERLARQAARQPPQNSEPAFQILKGAASSKRQRSVSPSAVSREIKRLKGSSQKTTGIQQSQRPLQTRIRYPRGTIRQTWAYGHARTDNDIKIEEVLEKSTLKTALLSAFMWDTNWIMGKLDLQHTKVIMVMQAETEAIKQRYHQETAYLGKILRLCFPSMEGNVNCMHSKLMLLFHPHKLRVVIPSANLTSYDWGETGIMENSVFIIDLPRLETPSSDTTTMPQFGQELLFFLEKMDVDEDVRQGVARFNFSNTGHLAFVHSIGGGQYGTDMERTGYVGLSKAIRELKPDSKSSLRSTSNLQIDYAASSIGSIHDEFLTILHNAARGEDATATPISISRTAPKPFQRTSSTSNIRDSFRVYFPTHNTVEYSTGGTDNGGTICLQKKWWTGDKFPRSCFRDYRSKRNGMLSHNKILYARGVNAEGKKVSWQYVGSANLSESAWGKLSWDRKQKEWKIGCRNWECGVIVSVMEEEKPGRKLGSSEVVVLSDDEEDAETDSGDVETDDEDEGEKKAVEKTSIPSMDIFNSGSGAGVPFEYPGTEYKDKEPWFFMG